MPFKSEKQRRYLWANEPEIARDWTDTYGSRIQKNSGGVASQGGVKNYLGKQPMVSAPKYWQSSPDHPTTELAYITPAEKDLLVKQDLHGSLNGGVNRGPSGIMSLNGWGSSDASQNRAGADISSGMDKSASDKGWSGPGGFTSPHAKSPAQLNLLAGKKGSSTVMPGSHYGKGPTKQKSGIGGLILGAILGMINPALGMAYRGYQGIKGLGTKFGTQLGDWRENLTGYRTQKEWEDARKQRQLQSRFDKLMDRKLSGKNYSQKNLDMLSAMGINPSKNSLAAALARDANQSMNMFDGPFSRTHLQSVAEGLPPQGPSGMYNLDDMLMDKAMGPYSSQPGPWNEMGAFKAPMQSPTGIMKPGMYGSVSYVDPSQQQFGGGITHTPQGQGFWGNLFSNFPRM
jgi:hypothetical protein